MRQLLGWIRPQEYHGLDYDKAPLPAGLSGARLSTDPHGRARYHLMISPAGTAGHRKASSLRASHRGVRVNATLERMPL